MHDPLASEKQGQARSVVAHGTRCGQPLLAKSKIRIVGIASQSERART